MPQDPPDQEQRITELTSQLEETTRTLDEVRQSLTATERKRQIERHLTAGGAIDLDAATLLAEAAIAGTDNPDIAQAITDLKRTKPYLFRPPPAQRTSAMSGEVAPAPALDQAALEARRTGDRRALARYLRLRRGH